MRTLSRNFEHGRFLVIGAAPHKLASQFAEGKREAVMWSHNELVSKLSRGANAARFETAIWLYPSVQNEDDTVAEALSSCADSVDLCLKMRRAGYLIVYTPFVQLYWHDIQPGKIDTTGQAIMEKRWTDLLQGDPYYNSNLSRESADFSLGK